jgi:amino acid permease
MEKNKENSENKALVISTISTLVLALSVVIAVTGFFITKIKKDKAYIEKWKDYDECGLS